MKEYKVPMIIATIC